MRAGSGCRVKGLDCRVQGLGFKGWPGTPEPACAAGTTGGSEMGVPRNLVADGIFRGISDIHREPRKSLENGQGEGGG